MHGGMTTIFNRVNATQAAQDFDAGQFNSLIVYHTIEGAPATGGHVTVELRHTPGQPGIPHPAPAGNSEFGANVQTADTTTSYVMILRGVSRHVGIGLNVTDGIHTVRVEPVSL